MFGKGDQSWLRRLAGRFGTKADPPFGGTVSGVPLVSYTPALVDSIRLYGIGPTGYSQVFRSQPSIYTVVEFLAWQVSHIPLKVYRRISDTDREHLSDHPLTALLAEPTPGLPYDVFMHRTMADLGVYGNAYWLKEETGGQRALVPLPPQGVTPKGGNLLNAASYDLSYQQVQQQGIPAERIIHLRRYNPDDPRVGVSPLEPLKRILAEEAAASAQRESFWRNYARMEGVLLHPGNLSDAAVKRLRESFEATYTGAGNAGRIAILEEGMEVKPMSFSPKDSEFIAGRKLVLETIARAYNIPLSVLGLTDTATYASQREFHKALYQDTLGPWLKMIEGAIRFGVIPWLTDETDIYVEFNLSEKLRGSFEEQADAIRAYGGVPIMTVNELRALFNLPRIDDPAFDVPVMPANVIYGGAGSPGLPAMPEAANVVQLATKEANSGGDR